MSNLIKASVIILGLTFGVGASASAVTLYDGSIAQTPISQGSLVGAGARTRTFSGTTLPLPVPVDQTLVADGVRVDTDGFGAIYSGYASTNPGSDRPLNPAFPELDRDLGYSVFFNFSLDASTDNSSDRSAFSILAISEDLMGIELGFEPDSIFAQNSNFTRGEASLFDTSFATDYELRVLGNGYQLFADELLVLSGALRAYDLNLDNSLLPFDPYGISNFIFFGDNTSREWGEYTFRSASVQTASSVPEPITVLGSGLALGYGTCLKRRSLISLNPLIQNQELRS